MHPCSSLSPPTNSLASDVGASETESDSASEAGRSATAETLRRLLLRLRLSTLFHCGGCFRRISWAAGSGADAPAVSPYELL
jgi:hypothetical protein